MSEDHPQLIVIATNHFSMDLTYKITSKFLNHDKFTAYRVNPIIVFMYIRW